MDARSNERLAAVLRSEPIYTNLGIADPEGKVVASAIPFTGQMRMDQRPFFQRAFSTRAFAVGNYEVNPISGEPGLNLGHPLFGEDGKLRGVLFASLGLDWADERVRRANLPEGATLLVVDAEGTIIARSFEPEKWVGKKMAHVNVIQRMLSSDGVSEAFAPDQDLFGEERLLAHLSREPGATAAETVACVLGAVRRHAAGAAQSDDITILAVRWFPDRVRA
jgi:hypothetical protein